jgi:hypothetical protein
LSRALLDLSQHNATKGERPKDAILTGRLTLEQMVMGFWSAPYPFYWLDEPKCDDRFLLEIV